MKGGEHSGSGRTSMAETRQSIERRQGVALTPDGERLAFRVAGTGRPLLVFNGLVSDTVHWIYFVPHFERSHAVVTWDYRGHAGQPPPADPATLDVAQFAEDGHTVLRVAQPEGKAILAGLSFGVQVALEAYRRHPEDVAALILICGTAGHPLDRISRARTLREGAARLARGLARGGPAVQALVPRLTRLPIWKELAFLTGGAHRQMCPQEVLDGLFAHVSSLPPVVLGQTFAAYFEHSAWDVLPTIEVPTLIIAGDHDQLTPVSTAERMHRLVRGSRLVTIHGHSHLAQVERPDDVHAAIDAFLADRGL